VGSPCPASNSVRARCGIAPLVAHDAQLPNQVPMTTNSRGDGNPAKHTAYARTCGVRYARARAADRAVTSIVFPPFRESRGLQVKVGARRVKYWYALSTPRVVAE